MSDPINGVAKIIGGLNETAKAADNILKSSLYGRYVQRPGETDEAYQARLQFLKERQIRLQEARKERQEQKAERQEAKHRRRLERAEVKANKKQ